MGGRRHTNKQKIKILKFVEANPEMSLSEIAKKFKITRQTLHLWMKEVTKEDLNDSIDKEMLEVAKSIKDLSIKEKVELEKKIDLLNFNRFSIDQNFEILQLTAKVLEELNKTKKNKDGTESLIYDPRYIIDRLKGIVYIETELQAMTQRNIFLYRAEIGNAREEKDKIIEAEVINKLKDNK